MLIWSWIFQTEELWEANACCLTHQSEKFCYSCLNRQRQAVYTAFVFCCETLRRCEFHWQSNLFDPSKRQTRCFFLYVLPTLMWCVRKHGSAIFRLYLAGSLRGKSLSDHSLRAVKRRSSLCVFIFRNSSVQSLRFSLGITQKQKLYKVIVSKQWTKAEDKF